MTRRNLACTLTAVLAGLLVPRPVPADAPLLLGFTGFAASVAQHVGEHTELVEKMRKETAEKNRRIDDGVYAALFDPRETWAVPERQEPVPYINFAPLPNALARLEKSAREYRKALDEMSSGERTLADEARRELDGILMETERALTREEGLQGRPWCRHQIYAPGVYTGYAAKTLPGTREAIEQREWKLAEEQIAVAAATLERFAGEIERATAVLSRQQSRPDFAGYPPG